MAMLAAETVQKVETYQKEHNSNLTDAFKALKISAQSYYNARKKLGGGDVKRGRPMRQAQTLKATNGGSQRAVSNKTGTQGGPLAFLIYGRPSEVAAVAKSLL